MQCNSLSSQRGVSSINVPRRGSALCAGALASESEALSQRCTRLRSPSRFHLQLELCWIHIGGTLLLGFSNESHHCASSRSRVGIPLTPKLPLFSVSAPSSALGQPTIPARIVRDIPFSPRRLWDPHSTSKAPMLSLCLVVRLLLLADL